MRQDCAQSLLRLSRWGWVVLSFTVTPVLALPNAPVREATAIDAQEQIRQQERERVLHEENTPRPDARLRRPDVALPDYPQNESTCFVINSLRLTGDSADRFACALVVPA